MEFSRQEYWSELPCPPPRDLPEPGTESASPVSLAVAGRRILYHFATWEAHFLSLVTALKGKLQQSTDEENTLS